MNVQTLKGFRDFLPTEARKRQYVISTLKKVFESYGFEPLETPVLEYEEILAGKYGDEGDKLMYRFEDNGGRRVAMRYDQTVPLARVVAQYGYELPTPFKRYQISSVWRADNTQKGRYREFLQCDIDIVGSSSYLADVEILQIVYECYKKLGLDIKIKINDRNLLNTLSADKIIAFDKLDKIGEKGVIEELKKTGLSPEEAEKALRETKALKASINLREIINSSPESVSSIIDFQPTLARGLNYYTGMIIEAKSESYTGGSLGGGGRYDNLIGTFAGRDIPAVGFAFGFDRLVDAMTELNLLPADLALSTTTVLVTVFSEELKSKSLEIANMLRNLPKDAQTASSKDAPNGASRSNNINTELYLGEIKAKNPLEKQLKYADQKNIPYVVIIGPEEAEKGIVTLKNLKTREQKQVTVEELSTSLL